jgi:hypothetical protein
LRNTELERRRAGADELLLVNLQQLVEDADSTSVISRISPSWIDKAVAASRPAVPPPAITTFLTPRFCKLDSGVA